MGKGGERLRELKLSRLRLKCTAAAESIALSRGSVNIEVHLTKGITRRIPHIPSSAHSDQRNQSD